MDMASAQFWAGGGESTRTGYCTGCLGGGSCSMPPLVASDMWLTAAAQKTLKFQIPIHSVTIPGILAISRMMLQLRGPGSGRETFL